MCRDRRRHRDESHARQAQLPAAGEGARGYEERDGGLSLVKVDPGLDSLRAETRFTAILERVGLS